MIIERLTIKNLFCYRGEQTFDLRPLPPASGSRNIALIWGRNGHGKTSFLNSLKLLFTGVTEDMRASIARSGPGRKLGVTSYIVGRVEDAWPGVLNQGAVRRGEADFWVEVEWYDPSEHTRINARRAWTLRGEEGLRIWLGDELVEGKAAEDLLNERLPRVTVPFFFFDGELIQELAEDDSGESRREAIESLLELNRLEALAAQLGRLKNDWTKKGAVAEAKLALVELETQQRLLQAQIDEINESIEREGRALSDLQRQIARREQDIRQVRRRGTEVDRGRLEQQLKDVQREQSDRITTAIPELLARAPLMFNPSLVARVNDLLTRMEGGAGSDAALTVLQRMVEDLPTQVFDRGWPSQPPLTAQQIAHYKDILRQAVDFYIPKTPTGPWRLPPARCVELRQRIESQARSSRERGEAVEHLRRAAQARQRTRELRAELHDVTDLSAQDRLRLDALEAERAALLEERGGADARLERLRSQLKIHERELTSFQPRIEEARRTVELCEEYRARVAVAERSEAVVRALISMTREQRRHHLEASIHTHLDELLTSHTLIASTTLDANFNLCHRDHAGRVLGKAGFSAGMKQLIAVAFLWGLTDAARNRLPVVIDTPLGRLDADHRERILNVYLPRVARQVIVLPTDAEIRQDEYERLKPHIYREFRIHNPTGDEATVKADVSMHPTPRPDGRKRRSR